MRESRSRGMLVRAAASAVLLALLLLAPAAGAAEPVASGKTRLELGRPLLTALRGTGVRLSSLGPAKVAGRFVILPSSEEGRVDFGSGSGRVELEGGLRLAAGRRTASLTAISLDTAGRALWAKVDGGRTKLASIPRFKVEREGFGDRIAVPVLKLQPKAAALLNGKLGLMTFSSSGAFASVSSAIKPLYDTVASGSLQFTLDDGFVAKLKTLGVEPVRFEVAPGPAPFSYSAPLLSGSIYPELNGGGGTIEGGLRIENPTGPGPVITWANLGFSLEGNTVPANVMVHTEAGQLAPAPAGPIAALDLSGSTARIDSASRTVTMTGAVARLEASEAELINDTFAKPKGKAPVMAAGDLLGTFSLTMIGR